MVSTGDERYGVNETGVDRVRSFDVECRWCRGRTDFVLRVDGVNRECRRCRRGVSTVTHTPIFRCQTIFALWVASHTTNVIRLKRGRADDRCQHEFAFPERLKRRKKCDATSQYELANMPVNNFRFMKAGTPQT